LGSAAYEDVVDLPFDDEGAAADAQAYAIQRANHTGAQLLSTISDVTATGSSLAKAASVDAARGVLVFPAVAMPPRQVDHSQFTWTAANVNGASFNTVNAFLDMRTNAVASSSSRIIPNSDNLILNRSTQTIDFARKIEFYGFARVTISNAEGVFRALFCKASGAAFGLDTAGYYIGFEVQDQTPTLGIVCVNGTVVTTPLTGVPSSGSFSWYIVSENGSVQWYFDGVLAGSTLSGPTAGTSGTINFEVNNGATAANYRIRFYSQSRGH
jgi:hypothetical protein